MWLSSFFVYFRVELNQQKQHSYELETQLETVHNVVSEVCVNRTHSAVQFPALELYMWKGEILCGEMRASCPAMEGMVFYIVEELPSANVIQP